MARRPLKVKEKVYDPFPFFVYDILSGASHLELLIVHLRGHQESVH